MRLHPAFAVVLCKVHKHKHASLNQVLLMESNKLKGYIDSEFMYQTKDIVKLVQEGR